MNKIIWKCNVCQKDCLKLIAPFSFEEEKVCFHCFSHSFWDLYQKTGKSFYPETITRMKEHLETINPYSVVSLVR